MDLTAFGDTKPLEQQMEHALRAYPAHMGEDITNIMRAALVTIQCYKSWLAQADAREARLTERLDKIDLRLQSRECRWLVKGTIEQLSREGDQQWEESRIVLAPTRDEAERLFVEHWESKSTSNNSSYYATVTHCSGELAKE